jgi:hypothetical protein
MRLAEIDRVVAVDFPAYAVPARPEPVPIEDVQRLLTDGEALILFLDTPA